MINIAKELSLADETDLQLALLSIPEGRGSQRHKALIEFVLFNPFKSTSTVQREVGTGNVSCLASRTNRYLEPLGLEIASSRPALPFIDRYGERSPMCVWAMYRADDYQEKRASFRKRRQKKQEQLAA